MQAEQAGLYEQLGRAGRAVQANAVTVGAAADKLNADSIHVAQAIAEQADGAQEVSGYMQEVTALAERSAADIRSAVTATGDVSSRAASGLAALQQANELMQNAGNVSQSVVDNENRPQRGQFLPDSQPHGLAMGQEDSEKWTAAVVLQPTIPKSDSFLGYGAV